VQLYKFTKEQLLFKQGRTQGGVKKTLEPEILRKRYYLRKGD